LGERLHPNDELMPLLRAHVLIEEYRPEEALVFLDKMQVSNDFYWNYLRMGALADLQRWEEAKEAADKALACDSDIVAAALDISRVFFDRDQLDLSLHYLLIADAANEDNTEVLELIVECYTGLKKYSEALPYVERLIDDNPYSVDAWRQKAALDIDMGKYDIALEDFEYAIAINPQDESTLVAKIKLLLFLGRFDEALPIMNIVEGFSSEWKNVCMMLRGDMYYLRGNIKKAHSYYYKGFNRHFFIADSAMRYLDCKMALRRWRGAVMVGNCLLKYLPDDRRLLEHLSDAYFELKEFAMSAKMLRRCLKNEPDNVYLLLRYGSLLLDMQELKKAYTTIHRAYRLSPDISQTNLLMAVVCWLRKENKRMYQYYRRACSLDKSSRDTFLTICPELKSYIDRLDALARQCEKNGIKDIERELFKKK
jgi:tetratricopeptide (TPR) repeat protein